MIWGIDISTYQNGINFDNIKKLGINYVIIRGGFSGINKNFNKDSCFEEFYKSAKENNLNVGVYYYSRATTYEEGKNEAKALYANCLKNKVFEYPIFIDVEDSYYQKESSKEDIDNAIRGFCDYIESKKGYAGVYCNLNWADNHMNYNILSKDYDFWLAYWAEECPKREKYGDYGMWQFGGETNLIKSNKIDDKICDQDYAYKNYPQIMKDNNLNSFISEDNSIKKELENDIEEEIKDEIVNNKQKIFNIIFKFFKNLIGIIFLKLKK